MALSAAKLRDSSIPEPTGGGRPGEPRSKPAPSREGPLLLLLLVSIATAPACAPPAGPGGLANAGEASDPGEAKLPAREPDEPDAGAPSTDSMTGDSAAGPELPAEDSRPRVERLETWGDVREALPKDVAGGVDWVQAIRTGVVAPRSQPDPNKVLEPPFTLDTLARTIASNGKAPLDFDVELMPEADAFFKVVFPHSSHTLWLNCSSCHPGIIGKRAGMEKILSGEYCGMCHGKVAFAPETTCARCHVNLAPPDTAELEIELAAARAAPAVATPSSLKWGKVFYEGLCAICHGKNGDGKGRFAGFLNPKPRDFTEGTFKFRTTPSGSLPTDLDLFRTITMGLKGTGMPSWFALPSEDRWALVHYIKTFSEIFDEEEPEDPIEFGAQPAATPEILAQGMALYDEAKCWDCHGREGMGDGPSAGQLKDDRGSPILPADFTSGVLRAGTGVKDVFRSLSTGLDGTPMPSYGDVLSQEERWALAHYVASFTERQRGFGLEGIIQFTRYTRNVVEEPPATFPHWFHRVRFKCAACHPGIFQMKAGANRINMDAIRAGEFCARCHDGHIAWSVGFPTCRNCHVGHEEVPGLNAPANGP